MGSDKKYVDDSLIADLCRDGADSDAFRRLFYKYYPMVFNFTKGIVKSLVVAEDIAQNTFMKLWLNRFHLKPGLSVKNYLFVLSRNEAINYLRSNQARNVAFESYLDYSLQNPTTEEWLNFTETNVLLRNNIDALPPQRRKIFKMSRYDNMSNIEIAVKLNLSLRTVEKHIELALKDLRRSIS